MARGAFPSMTPCLGLLAVDGDQDRHQISGMLGSRGVGGASAGGLGELDVRMRQNGRGETVDSWCGTGPNRVVAPQDLRQAPGQDVLDDLQEHTGPSREMPNAVDQHAPHKRMPNDDLRSWQG